MPGNESYEDPYSYAITNPRQKSVGRGRGRSSKSRTTYNPYFEGSSRSDGIYRDFVIKDEDCMPTNRKRIKASHYENFVRKHPGGTKLCLLCKLEDNQLNCQGVLKWFSVKSKRGPGRPRDKGQPKAPRYISSFLNCSLDIVSTPKVITLKTDTGAHSEPIKIKIDMSKGVDCLPNGNGFLDPEVTESCGFYIHVECCRWTSSVSAEIEMFKAERYLLKGLGQVCAHCNMNGATVCCQFETCKKKFHVACGLLSKCVPDIASSSMMCSEHFVGQNVRKEVPCSKCHEDKCHNSMLHCLSCGSHTHQQCLPADVHMKPLVIAGWQCDMCKSCPACKKTVVASPTPLPIIPCTICSKAYHTECIDPSNAPSSGYQWRCKICRNCTDCGTEVPFIHATSRFTLPHVLCANCYGLRVKGMVCCICYKSMCNQYDSTRCERCKSWIHPGCESIDPELLEVHNYNVYLCPVCRPGGKQPVVSRAAYNAITDPNVNGPIVDETFDETSQDSMSFTSENDDISLTPISSSHNSPGSSSLDSFYTVMPTKKGRIGVGLKISRPTSRKMPKIMSGEGSFMEKRDGVLPNEVVLYNESDQFTHQSDLCVMCGSKGANEDGIMLICHQCAKCYHSYCSNKNVVTTMLQIGWRCKECQICEGCSKPGDEGRLLLCEDCDISFHTYCLSPPLEKVPTGPWRCSWCVKCEKCERTSPGVHATWYRDYSVCGPCHSQVSCATCNIDYAEDDFLVKCFSCEHHVHGKCEKILSEEAVTKKFVCSLCEELVKKEGKPSTGPKKLQSNTFSATKQALDSVIKHDARISSYMDKDEKQFEAERDEREKQRIFGIDYIMALKKKRHQENQKNKRFSGQDKDPKLNQIMETGLIPPKDISSSQTYQQIIREITGGMSGGNKAANKRGRGRSVNRSNEMMSPTKESNIPRVRGRPRGSRNKTTAQRNRGKGMPHPDMLQQQLTNDDTITFPGEYGGMGMPPPSLKSPLKGTLKRSNSNKGRGKLIPQIMDPSAIGKPDLSPAKMNSEIAMNFFGDELMPPAQDIMSPPPHHMMGPPLIPPTLSSPVSHPMMSPGKPPYNQIKGRIKPPPPSPLIESSMKTPSVPPSPSSAHNSPKPQTTPIKKELPEQLDLSKVNIDEIKVCPESPAIPDHPDTLPDYNNREFTSKPIGQEVEEEEKVNQAVSTYFAGLLDEELELEETAKGSPIYNPPDPNTKQLTLKDLADLDEGNDQDEIPSELNAILESLNAKPMGTEIDESQKEGAGVLPSNRLDLELGDEFLGLQLEGFDFPSFFDDITTKKNKGELQKGQNERSQFDKLLETPANKRQSNMDVFKTWEEEERKGNLGTVPQLLYASKEMGMFKSRHPDPMERYKVVHLAFNRLSKEDKETYINLSRENVKLRKNDIPNAMNQPAAMPAAGTPGWQQQQFENSRMVNPAESEKLSLEDQKMLRQSQRDRRQRLYERHPTNRQIKEGMLTTTDPMIGGWPRFRGPEDASNTTVNVGPIPPKGGIPPHMTGNRDGAMTQGPMTPGPMTPGAIRSPMTPRGMSPMNVQMIPQGAMMPGGGFIQRHMDPNTGQWIQSGPGAHTPLRHLSPQAIMAQQQAMDGSYNHIMDQFGMQKAPEVVQPPPKTKKRSKKKKEKTPVEPHPPIDPQVNLEHLPPHLRIGPQAQSPAGPGHPGFEYPDHFRQNIPGVPIPLAKNFKQANSPLLKSPSTGVEMERPKSLNISSSPTTTAPKSHPNTPNKASASKNSSPLIKPEDFGPESNDSQLQQKQAIRIALEQRKQQQHNFYMNQQQMMMSSHMAMTIPQFVQFRMQDDWLKRFTALKNSGSGGLPPVPQHPSNLTPQQIQTLYSKLMEHSMYRFASMPGGRMAMAMAHPGMINPMMPAEEEKKTKAKKRKKKKTETPVKKDDKSKLAKMGGANLVMQTAMGPGPLRANSPQTPDGFMPHHPGPITPNSMGFQMNMASQGGNPHLGLIPNQKYLNMRIPGPALMAGPHVSPIPGQTHQQQRHMAPNFTIALSQNNDLRHIRPTLTAQKPHFHDNFDIEPPRSPRPAPKSTKSKAKLKETLQLSAPKSAEVPLQADSPRYQHETPRYQHQIKIEDNQDFSESPRSRTPTSQRSVTPSSTMKDPFDQPPLTPALYNSLENAKRRKRRTKAEMEEIRAEKERIGCGPPLRAVSKNIPPVVQPDIGRMVDIVVRGTGQTSHCKLVGSYGRAVIQNQHNYYRDLVTQIRQSKDQRSNRVSPRITSPTTPIVKETVVKETARFQKQLHVQEQSLEKMRSAGHPHHPLTLQQEKMLCQRFGVTPAEAQKMYYFQQHQHMMALREQQYKTYQIQEQMEQSKLAAADMDKTKILEQIRMLQESREKNSHNHGNSQQVSVDKIKEEDNVSVSVKQQSDSIQLIFQRPEKQDTKETSMDYDKPLLKHPHKPKLELTRPTPPAQIKQEFSKDSGDSMSPRDAPFAITGPDYPPAPAIKPCNPPTDEKTTRVINLHKAFQRLSDILGMKLKKLNLASLNELRVQNIIPGSLPHNLVCYNCVKPLHPNKLKDVSPGRPFYGIKDEHGATFCVDHCLAQYYCRKFSSLWSEDEHMMPSRPGHMICNPPPLKQHFNEHRRISSPGKRRRESETWKYWSRDSIPTRNFVNKLEENKRLFEMFKKWHEHHSTKTDVVDRRVCLLCGGVGDGTPNGPSRLLNYRKNTWIHLNCALWSNEVYETRDGSLVNISQTCKRAQDTACTYCKRIGASIECFRAKCSTAYHFLCARHTQCYFYTDKTFYCHDHYIPGEICSDFTVRRRVVLEKDIQQLLTECFKDTGDKIRIGPMIYHHPGHILNNTNKFHSRELIYPFDYSASRMYWSTDQIGKRCLYHCGIDINNELPIFKLSYNKGEELVELADTSVDELWKGVLNEIAEIRSKSENVLTLHTMFHKGCFLHGLTERNMLRVIEGLPGSDKLEGYTFSYGRIETVTLEHLVPFNPSQSARTEKYTKHTKRVGGHRQISSSVQGSVSKTPNLWSRELGAFNDMLPYQKSFNRASQYRRLKTEWKLNVLLRRSGIQGLGLYARRFIDRNTMVIEYVGQLIRTSLCDQREVYYNGRNIGCYMFKIDDVVAIDATLTGGPARYINHSCEPNCVAEIVTFERYKKIIIISNRKIRQGEELTYDYKFDFEDDSEKIPCNCGSVMCRKWMN